MTEGTARYDLTLSDLSWRSAQYHLTDGVSGRVHLIIDEARFEELGKPGYITVTVEAKS